MTQAQSNSSTNSNTSQSGNVTQQSNTNPWGPTIGGLQGLIGGIQALPMLPSAAQQAALGQLQGSVANLPNYGPTAANTANAFLTGDPTGLLYTGNNNLQNTLSPIANQPLDPTKSPIVQNLLDNIKQQVTTGTNANAAAAGRSLNSGDNAAATAYGLGSAELPLLLGQYNTNQQNIMNAGSQMFGANYGTANAASGNMGQGLNMAAAVPAYYAQNANAQLQAANAAQQLPLQNIGASENLLLPISGLGGRSSGTGTSNQTGTGVSNTQTTFDPSLLQSLAMGAGILGGNGGLFGGLSNAGNAFSGVSALGSGLANLFK